MDNYSKLCQGFVTNPKSMIIAPAGHGKTHTIAECMEFTKGNQLILTHTHAGVASLKFKISKLNSTCSCTIETISSFAQKYVNAFYQDDMPDQDDKEYFPFIIKEGIKLFGLSPIAKILKANYCGLFVDEYQDCTVLQHDLIMTLSKALPTHILGDPLQGIFGFNDEPLIDMGQHLKSFDKTGELTEPWRWKDSNQELGECLKNIREKLIRNEEIDFSNFQCAIELHVVDKSEMSKPNTIIWRVLSSDKSLLVIHPISHNLNGRKRIVGLYKNMLHLVEAVDGKEFYSFSKKMDACKTSNFFKTLSEIGLTVFNKTAWNNWFNKSGVKNKRNLEDKKCVEPIKYNFKKLSASISYGLIADTLKLIGKLPEVKCYRRELLKDLCKALYYSEAENIPVYEKMKSIRNDKRRNGRILGKKCIGTTLLTKGLEFDTVVILNANEIECSKNLYVALTRASKRLIVFSEKNIWKAKEPINYSI